MIKINNELPFIVFIDGIKIDIEDIFINIEKEFFSINNRLDITIKSKDIDFFKELELFNLQIIHGYHKIEL